MEITGTKNDSELTVTLSGRLDTNTSPELESYLRDNLSNITDLSLDLSDVQYVSSAGLRVFLYAYKELAKTGGQVVLTHPNTYISDVLDATGFTELMKIEN
jgi:anti-sigma B factor antagonist